MSGDSAGRGSGADRDPTGRFSDRVDDYVRYRPGYPEALLRTLEAEAGLGPGRDVADVGSGTGISTHLLLRSGARVLAVEPNAAMRRAAERELAGEERFVSVDGTAEATGLPDASVDLVAAGQAFHWFDRPRAREEFRRILRRERRCVALFWNSRRPDATPFLRAYEDLLLRLGTDYRQVDHTRLGREVLDDFFGGPYRSWRFDNHQLLDHDGLRGRLLSSSYVPPSGHPNHEPLLAETRCLFDEHQQNGHVRIDYDTELYVGRL